MDTNIIQPAISIFHPNLSSVCLKFALQMSQAFQSIYKAAHTRTQETYAVSSLLGQPS